MDWYCARSKKQGHRLRVETPSLTLHLRFDKEEDSLVWFETIQSTISEYSAWIQNNHPSPSPTSCNISGPFNVTKTSTDELFQVLTTPPSEENKQSKKLGRKGTMSICLCLYSFFVDCHIHILGISKSFRRVASGLSIKMKSDADVELRSRNNLDVKTPAARRR